MKKKSSVLLFVIAICFFSCKRVVEVDKNISNISTDFPVSEKIELKHVNEYNVMAEIKECIVDDSILWIICNSEDNFGYCFDLNTGERLSVIANKGKASYEFINMYKAIILSDSIQFHTDLDVIKTCAKKDIIENKPMNERKFVSTPIPDSIFTCKKIKLSNGLVLATMCGAKFITGPVSMKEIDKYINSEFNKKMVAIFNDNEANSYETINYDNLYINKGNMKIDDIGSKMKRYIATSHIGIKGNNMAVFSLEHLFLLYTFNLNSKKAVKEKVYEKLNIYEFSTATDMRLRTKCMKCNDKYIVCIVEGYLSKEDEELDRLKKGIFVFDWDLNPIKRFDLPKNGRVTYFISEDCSSVYGWEQNDDGISLFKSDLLF